MRKELPFVGMALACGLIVSTLAVATRDRVVGNQRAFELRRVLSLTGDGPLAIKYSAIKERPGGYVVVHEGKTIVTISRVSTDAGYNGRIALLVGAAAGVVTGVRVVKHAETPGLGDAIDHGWLDVAIGKNAQSQWRVTRDGGDIDQITGATITSSATLQAISDHLIHQAEAGNP